VLRDLKEPRREQAAPVERRERPVDADEDLLGHVLGQRPIARQHPHQVVEERRLVLLHQDRERVVVTALCPAERLGIRLRERHDSSRSRGRHELDIAPMEYRFGHMGESLRGPLAARPPISGLRCDGPCRDRTCDLGIKSPLLYQLS
jgi:hypothetical protein